MTAVFKMMIVKMMTMMMTVYDVADVFDVDKGDGVYCRRQLTCCFLGKQFIIKLFCCSVWFNPAKLDGLLSRDG